MKLDGLHEGIESLDGLGRLGEKVYRAGEIKPVDLFRTFYYDGGVVGLTLQTDDFCMARLTVNHNLRRLSLVVLMRFVAGTDAVLQFLHHRTGGVNDFNPSLLRNPVCARRLAVRAKQYPRMRRQRAQIVVIDGRQTFHLQTRYLLTVMHDIAQTIKRTVCQFAFCCFDRARHTKAKSAMLVNGNLHAR